uniref:Non-structural maintenance of chromosomes element 1 homolog n=2 Tax=Arion vulgaris TaxID=1028688 RepID=A0A0B6ZPW6_9EUPU
MQSQAHSPKIRDSAEKRKMFLQCFLSQGILNAREVKNLLKKCDVQVDSKEEMAKYVQNANASIAFVNLEIKKGIQEEDGASFYCLVNTVETSISRMLSTYSPNELELFKKLIEQIVETEDGKIGSLAALSLTEKLDKRMGKEEAQNFLERLEKDKWIKKESDGKISLSVRSIVELDQYLKDMYQEVIKMCYICTKICLLGEICPKCGIKIHKKCAQTLFDNRTEKKCPDRHCRALWE